MNFRSRNRGELDVNITPLIDVVFLLLIFFMVSTTFQKKSELSVQLPSATTQTVESTSPIEIVINPVGEYFVSGKALVNNKKSTLRTALIEVTGGRIDIPLVLRADARSPHQSVVTVMDIAAQLGLVKLSIATSQTDSQIGDE